VFVAANAVALLLGQ